VSAPPTATVEIRQVEGEPDVAAFLAIREEVDPEHPMTREAFDEVQSAPGRLDLLAVADGVAVGCAFVERQHGDPASTLGYVSVRVLEGYRRRGIGTGLLRRCSDHTRSFGGTSLYAVARTEAVDSLAFLAHHGLEEVGRMQDVELELDRAEGIVSAPAGVAIVPLSPSLEPGAHEVALEADADVPSATPVRTGSLDRWRERNLGPLVLRELSFAAVAGGEVVGYAIAGRCVPGIAEHWMTGVRRDWRGRGVAKALKQAQIAAAKEAGLARLRTQNDLANAAMRRVNESLGYESRLEWVHLSGPVLPCGS
jgi:mycothiol synthase